MKRELKFRAWVGEQMIEWDNLKSLRYAIENENTVVMQYTGLKDKNGKEIYEGDIINLGIGNLLVEFKDGGFGWKSVMFGDSFIGFAGHTNFNKIMPRCVVVGNIHETPELLQPKAGGV